MKLALKCSRKRERDLRRSKIYFLEIRNSGKWPRASDYLPSPTFHIFQNKPVSVKKICHKI